MKKVNQSFKGGKVSINFEFSLLGRLGGKKKYLDLKFGLERIKS